MLGVDNVSTAAAVKYVKDMMIGNLCAIAANPGPTHLVPGKWVHIIYLLEIHQEHPILVHKLGIVLRSAPILHHHRRDHHLGGSRLADQLLH